MYKDAGKSKSLAVSTYDSCIKMAAVHVRTNSITNFCNSDKTISNFFTESL